jgi:hypothetical protein
MTTFGYVDSAYPMLLAHLLSKVTDAKTVIDMGKEEVELNIEHWQG